MNTWYQSPLGKALLEEELTELSNILPKVFGYYIVQIGGPSDDNKVLAATSIHNHIIINPDTPIFNNSLAIQCALDELPFIPETIDAVVMLHVLEFAQNPKIVLKEVYDALIRGGSLIILGFNPYSLWGITKLFKGSNNQIWGGKWISPGKLQHWLHQIGFHVDDYQTFYFRPASIKTKRIVFMEALGDILWPYFGASYIMVAQKTSMMITPVTNLKSLVNEVEIAKGLPKPTTRATQCNRN